MVASLAGGEAPRSSKIPFWRLVYDQRVVTDDIVSHPYPGSGTEDDPYVVTWIPNDPRNPMNFSGWKKWSITIMVSFTTLAVSLVSSAYTGGIAQVMQEFNVVQEIAILGVSLFVLGFAVCVPELLGLLVLTEVDWPAYMVPSQ